MKNRSKSVEHCKKYLKMANGGEAKARVVLQQCLSARLMVKPASETEEAEYVTVSFIIQIECYRIYKRIRLYRHTQCQKLNLIAEYMHQSFVATAPPPTGNRGMDGG